jgi:hypothetical protein
MRTSRHPQRQMFRVPSASAGGISLITVGVVLALSAVTAFAAEAPDDRVTPGATNPSVIQSNIDETICVRGWTRTIRPPESYTYRLKRAQLHSSNSPYFVFDARLRDFEEDHRVPLGLGGAPRDHRNLWPEPRHGQWDAERKDELEDAIHGLVCRHEMTLQQGQGVFLGDWREGYRRYVERR